MRYSHGNYFLNGSLSVRKLVPYMWPVEISDDSSTVLAADSSSAIVLKLNSTSDWTNMGQQINGSFAVLSEDAQVLAIGMPFGAPNYADEIPLDIETTVHKWDNSLADWTTWGNSLPGFPVALVPLLRQ